MTESQYEWNTFLLLSNLLDIIGSFCNPLARVMYMALLCTCSVHSSRLRYWFTMIWNVVNLCLAVGSTAFQWTHEPFTFCIYLPKLWVYYFHVDFINLFAAVSVTSFCDIVCLMLWQINDIQLNLINILIIIYAWYRIVKYKSPVIPKNKRESPG